MGTAADVRFSRVLKRLQELAKDDPNLKVLTFHSNQENTEAHDFALYSGARDCGWGQEDSGLRGDSLALACYRVRFASTVARTRSPSRREAARVRRARLHELG